MSTTTLTSVPSIVARIGGPLAIVMANPSAYVDGTPGKRVQIAVARIVETRPHLNVEESIGQILDLVMFHGVTNTKVLGKLIDGLALECVHLAANFLYEDGERGGTIHKSKSAYKHRIDEDRSGTKQLEKVADLTTSLSLLADRKITDTDDLATLIERLGGLDTVLGMGSVTLAEAYGYTEYDLVSLEEAQHAIEYAAATGERDED